MVFIEKRKMKSDIGITCIEPGFLATKMAKSDKVFWLFLDKAARQIMQAIDRKKKSLYQQTLVDHCANA